MHTKVNVVIPAYNPDEKLINIFKMMETQTCNVEKIVVINTCKAVSPECTDPDSVYSEVNEISDKYGYKLNPDFIEVHNIGKEEFDHGATRNLGASYVSSDCDYIVFMTQDAVPENDKLIENLMAPFENEEIGVAYARQIATDKSSLAEQFTRNFNYPDEDMIKGVDDIDRIGIKAFFCSNVCAMYKRAIYTELGGFVNKAVFNEDMVFANKLIKSGYKIAYASKATVIHTHDYTWMQQYRRNFDLAVSQKMNPQAFDGISSESEGIKYVKAAFKFFCKNKKPWLIVPFGMNCVFKLLGYRKGKKFESLTKKEIMKYTSNKMFFEKNM